MVYYGWALLHEQHRICERCDTALDILTPSPQSKSDSETGEREDEKGA